jgi:hypothetical protein
MDDIELAGAPGDAFQKRRERHHRIDWRTAQPQRLGTNSDKLSARN